MRKPETIWKLIAQKPWAALAAMLLVLVQAVLNVSEVVILEHFINGFSNFQWMQSVLFAIVLSAVCCFYYFQTPMLSYLNDKIRLQLRARLEQAVVEKTERISVAALEDADSMPPAFHVIKGEGIVFRYPGQEKPVLDGLDFTFYAGKNYALAGENGCGKTTLIKLLMGFYQPESGVITIDGGDIKEMGFAKLQSYFSAAFQDASRYDYTIRENIFISSLGTERREEETRRAEVLVTHRLGAVRSADRIIVLEHGSIVEMGSFEQLMKLQNHFYHIWNEQAKWYQ